MPGPQVHHHLTVQWAVEEGMPEADARVVAAADLQVDSLWPGSRKWTRHFNPTASLVWAPLYLRRAIRAVRDAHMQMDTGMYADGGAPLDDLTREDALVNLGRALHCRQDSIGHGILGLSHLRWRFGLMRRHPDFWELMPAGIRSRIEASTRDSVRRYLAAAGELRRSSGSSDSERTDDPAPADRSGPVAP